MKYLFFIFFTANALAQCGPGTPTINLEAKGGPFSGIARDHQGETGACYAAVAKNFLVALSNGKADASFLDVAIQYKKSQGETKGTLAGGLSCRALKIIQKQGFCPRELSTVERGEKDPTQTDNSFNLSVYAENMKQVQSLLKDSKALPPAQLKNAQAIARQIKKIGRVHFPLPVMSYTTIPKDSGDLRKLVGSAAKADLYWKAYHSKFEPIFVKALLQGQSSALIAEAYGETMGTTLSQLGLSAKTETFKKAFIENTSFLIDDEKEELQKRLKDSLSILRLATGDTSSSDEDLISSCTTDLPGLLPFLKDLEGITTNLDKDVSSDILFTSQGELKKLEDYLQVVIAPACYSSANRQPSPVFTCTEGEELIDSIKDDAALTPAQKVSKFRSLVVESLKDGLPLGNTFAQTPSSGHINTIVGLRYNGTAKKCEYLIRESQYGISEWQSEASIFEKIIALATVKRN